MNLIFHPINVVEIDLAAIEHNTREVRRLVGPTVLWLPPLSPTLTVLV
jgi:hypothetical protein